MTLQELLNIDSNKVRRDSSLMAIYIEYFKQEFGYSPNCAGCTFNSDFNKLKNKFKNPKTFVEQKEITFKYATRKGSILTYYVNGKPIRKYDTKLTEEFVEGYLTYGTEEQIEARKKEFKILPLKFRQTNEPEEQIEVSSDLSGVVSETNKGKKGRRKKNISK